MGDRAVDGTLIARADWSVHGLVPTDVAGYEATTSWSHWGGGASITQNGTFARGVYPDTTGSNANGGFALQLDESLGIAEIYVQMDVRYPLAAPAKQGLKFLKFFGGDGNGTTTFDSANFTFNPQYDNGGKWDWVAFGDGATTGNDTSNAIFFGTVDNNPASAGYNASWIGRSFGSETVLRPQGDGFQFDDNWHTIKVIAKYNTGTTSGNEVANGRFYVEIDGLVYLDAQDFFNRHPTNPRYFKSLELFGWTQNTQGFTIDYRNVQISTGGFV
jgi:hypothetical protein